MSRVIGYARDGTTGQKLDVQLETLNKIGISKIFAEKVSGVTRERPQFKAMLDDVAEGDTVVITKLDRIARSTRHLLEIVAQLKDRGVALKVLNNNLDTSTSDGKLMLTMLGIIAEFEREMLLERQAEGIARAKAEGKYKGRKPTARAKAKEILKLEKQGLTRKAIAEQLGIGVASVYRVLKDHKPKKRNAAAKPKSKPKEDVKKTVVKKSVRRKKDSFVDDRQQSLFDF